LSERTPLVTVAIPCYQHASYLEACLRSVAAQDLESKQILAIDDGSTDGTADILQRVGTELGIEWVRAPHRGLMPTLEDLLSRARGKYYVTMGSDDILPPGRLSLQSAYLEAHPEVFGCSGQALELHDDGSLRPMLQYLRGIPQVSFEDLFLARKEIHTVSMMWRRQLFLDAGGYDMDQSVEDLPLWLRMTRRYGPVHVLPDILVHYRVHGNNLHTKTDRVYSAFVSALDKHSDHPLYSKAVRAWKTNWFSALAQTDRLAAWKALPRLANPSLRFFVRFPKLLLPKRVLVWWMTRGRWHEHGPQGNARVF